MTTLLIQENFEFIFFLICSALHNSYTLLPLQMKNDQATTDLCLYSVNTTLQIYLLKSRPFLQFRKKGLLLCAKKQLLILNAPLQLKSVQCSIWFTGIQLQICFPMIQISISLAKFLTSNPLENHQVQPTFLSLPSACGRAKLLKTKIGVVFIFFPHLCSLVSELFLVYYGIDDFLTNFFMNFLEEFYGEFF